MIEIIRDYWQVLLIGQYPQGPLGGVLLTLILAIAGLVLSFPISVVLAILRISPFAVLRIPATVVVYTVRSVPLIMLVFWTYFLVPLLVGKSVSGVTTLLCTLVVYQAAYLSEVIRAGIQALPDGQMEGARALGLSYVQTVRKVLLPQAIYNMVPSIISQFVSTIKDTSLGYVISVQELTFAANHVNSQLLTKPFEVFMILALTYFAICFCLTELAHSFEKRVAKKRLGTQPTLSGTTNDTILES